MLKPALLALCPALFASMGVPASVTASLPASHPMLRHADSCADDVISVVLESTDNVPTSVLLGRAKLLFVMANKESGCRADPRGFNDEGAACGSCQVHAPERVIEGATCAKVRADRKLGMRVGLRLMQRLSLECGSIGAGLTAYAMRGQCPAKGWVLPEIAQRLKIAGVSPEMPWGT